jgi:hypothetical protein
MSKKHFQGRRNFMKMTAAGVAGLAMTKAGVSFAKTTGWTNGMAINPNISNMLVVECYDTKMITSNPTSRTFSTVTAAVNTAQVQANMDAMAMRLSGKSTAAAAWSTIFQKPATKNWSAVRVAIKVNIIATTLLVNVAVIGKICKELANLGVLPSNIIIYDGNVTYATDTTRTSQYPPYFSLTDPTKIAATISAPNSAALGGTKSVTITAVDHTYNVNCTADFVNGLVDILVNCSVNKGHGTSGNGNFTLSMKNHYGTFDPAMHDDTSTYLTRNYIFAINKSDPILGGTPPRQQLCIVDSLWAETSGNNGPPDANPYSRLVMGTFGPAVDYLTIKKIREPVMGATHNAAVVNAIMPAFGYTATDPTWVEISGTGSQMMVTHESTPSVQLTLSNGSFRQASTHFSLPPSTETLQIKIFDLRGSVVRELNASTLAGKAIAVAWDGKASNGSIVSEGEYLVRITTGSINKAGRIRVFRI